MQIIRAKTAGFCMGVSLALRKLDAALKEPQPNRLIMLGPIIHNPLVINYYQAKGVLLIEDLEQIQAADRVLIRAHGIPFTLEQALLQKNAHLIDATCPKVKDAQLAIANATKHLPLLLFGETLHPEVQGLISYAKNSCYVFSCLAELNQLLPQLSKQNYVLAAQTTQDKKEFILIEQTLKNWQAGFKLKVLHTICDATRKRQQEAVEIAKKVSAMLVIGGLNSGNTKRLVEIIRAQNIFALQVEDPAEISNLEQLRQYHILGITAGASTPKTLIDLTEKILHNLP